jgi:outer membrane protein assembly factor BamA
MMTRRAGWRAAWTLLAATAVPAPGAAQEPATRAEQLAAQRAEKAEHLTPPTPGGLERALLALENGRLLERLLNPAEGFYPKLGNVTAGSGFSLGAGYRRPELFGSQADFSAFAAASFTKYWMAETRLRMPRLANGRAFADFHIQRFDFPSEDYFGIGAQSNRDAHTTYGLQSTTVGAAAGFRLRPWLGVSGTVSYLTPEISSGEAGRSIEQLYDVRTAPGLIAQPDFMRYEAIAEVNFREPLGNPRRGGRYAVSFQQYDDRDLERHSFRRIDLDAQHYFPLINERRVIALHGFASSAAAADGHVIPFYMLRTLGGPDDLRGFRRFRFRDEAVLLLQAEYRWEIFTAVDGALFYDAGKVAADASGLSFDDLESDYGIGFRFGTRNGVFLRVEGAFGSSAGKHFILRFGHVF